jgi:hypothetical protein
LSSNLALRAKHFLVEIDYHTRRYWSNEMSMSAKRLLSLRSLFTLGLALLLPVSVATAEKLRISYASVTGNTVVISYIAQRAGLFEKYGLDVEHILITGRPERILISTNTCLSISN